MESYDDNEEKAASIASEPEVAYCNTRPVVVPHTETLDSIPEGYMSLKQFGELFHQKLDDCYAHLSGNNQ